jgi:hypothetical protein
LTWVNVIALGRAVILQIIASGARIAAGNAFDSPVNQNSWLRAFPFAISFLQLRQSIRQRSEISEISDHHDEFVP